MAVRSTVSLPRDLCREVDAWAQRNGLPNGPGHRAAACAALIKTGLKATELNVVAYAQAHDNLEGA